MNKIISIYGILQGANVLVFLAMIYVFSIFGENQYINSSTIWINGLICVLSLFVIRDGARNQNALIAVLAYIMVIHYELRIVSLNWTEFSSIFQERVDVTAHQINWILVYVAISYLLSWLGLHFINRDNNKVVNQAGELFKRKATRNVLILLYVSFFVIFLAAVGVPGIKQIVGILSVYFLNLAFMMLFGIGYFFYRWKDITHKEKVLFIAFLIIYVAVFTGIGRRSTIYGIAISFFFSMLAFNKVNVKLKYIIGAFALLPFMIWLYSYSTFTRQNQQQTLSIGEAVEMSSALSEQMDGTNSRIILAPIFDRIAFLDFTVEMIHNADYLRNYLTPSNYAKSVVDNILTPGFDLFDMPKMSNVIKKCYVIKGPPSVKKYHLDDAEDYHSDGVSWFGEAYLLFGKVLALPIILFVALIIRRYYLKLNKNKKLTNYWKLSIVLYMYYTLLYSYGLDWWLIYLVSFVINFIIFKAVAIRSIRIKKV